MDRAEIGRIIKDIIWAEVTTEWCHGEYFLTGQSDAADLIMQFIEPFLKDEEELFRSNHPCGSAPATEEKDGYHCYCWDKNQQCCWCP